MIRGPPLSYPKVASSILAGSKRLNFLDVLFLTVYGGDIPGACLRFLSCVSLGIRPVIIHNRPDRNHAFSLTDVMLVSRSQTTTRHPFARSPNCLGYPIGNVRGQRWLARHHVLAVTSFCSVLHWRSQTVTLFPTLDLQVTTSRAL